MKTLVLMWVLLQMLSLFAASDTNSNTNETYTLVNSNNLAKPDCPSRCGDLIIPYPFGIGFNSNCSISPEFDVYCNLSSDPPRASITNTTYTSIKNISDSTLRTSNIVSTRCYFPNDTIQREDRYNVSYRDWPYTISVINKLIVIGCNEYAWVTSDSTSTGCSVVCYKEGDTPGDKYCSGGACCQSSLPKNINYYATQFYALQASCLTNNGPEVIRMSSRQSVNPCTYAFVGDADEFRFKGETDLNDASLRQKIEASVPIVLEWAIGNLSCTEVEAKDDFACESSRRATRLLD